MGDSPPTGTGTGIPRNLINGDGFGDGGGDGEREWGWYCHTRPLPDPLPSLGLTAALTCVAECLALRDGLAYAIHRGWRNILVEGDSKLIIDCVKQEADPPWSICILIHDIKLLSSFCGHLSFNHIYREANFTADAVANMGHGLHSSKLWESGLPLNCSVPFFFDLFGPACPRDFCL
ncbi:hypothetical protein L3X38_031519 [Prunus dulcis]|uniref:RNase H type-1 domain-containing protein n=1 Tax=Prunus dulcis TaxID=3755 RepID=A0AAD4YU44_PRUDU|nr:hypothetical protein L3X38_031519 [Prunus dulcis]